MIQGMLREFEAYLREMDARPASIKAYLCELKNFIRWYEETAGAPPKTAAFQAGHESKICSYRSSWRRSKCYTTHLASHLL